MRLLVAANDSSLGISLKRLIEDAGFTVDFAAAADGADAGLRMHRYDAVVLDAALPADALLQGWRQRDDATPVVVLLHPGPPAERIRLFELGADDCIVRPFDLLELCARLRALIRRSGFTNGERLAFGNLQLLRHDRVASVEGRRVDLTNREFWILEALLRNRDRLLSRRQLEESLYGQGDQVESNAIEVHIHHLRRKLGSELIQTVRGVGYRLVAQDVDAPD